MLRVLNLPAPINRLLPIIVKPIASVPPLARFLSRKMINQFGYATTLRPRPLSLASDYTSWLSLTDKTFSGRHLPPSSPEYQAGLPSEAEVTALFRREQEVRSTDTTVAFVFFAQWFTDSFLRTDLNDFRKNESNHEIDMCQIYGRTIAQTDLLRSGVGGHLKSQLIDGEEFPAFLFQPRASGGPLVFKAEFEGLFDPAFITDVILGGAADERKDSFFAVGLEHGNSTIGSTMLNIVFIREHNRLADMLATDNPGLGRREGIPNRPQHRDRAVAEAGGRGVHRAHRPVGHPDGAGSLHRRRATMEPSELVRRGVQPPVPMALAGARRHRRGPGPDRRCRLAQQQPTHPLRRVGESAGVLLEATVRQNRPVQHPDIPRRSIHPDWPSVQERTITLSRQARLRTFNDYRAAYGLHRYTSFDQLTSTAPASGFARSTPPSTTSSGTSASSPRTTPTT